MVPPTSTGEGGGPEGELAYHRVPQRREKDQFTEPYNCPETVRQIPRNIPVAQLRGTASKSRWKGKAIQDSRKQSPEDTKGSSSRRGQEENNK